MHSTTWTTSLLRFGLSQEIYGIELKTPKYQISRIRGEIMTVKELIAELQKYDENTTVIFTDDRYESDDPDDEETCCDKVVSKECRIYEANYDNETEKSFPASDIEPNAIAISITGLEIWD
jgi:hypothetical protein